MMSSFGYRPSNAMISEGSCPKAVGLSRIAKPSSRASMISAASQEHGTKLAKEGFSNAKKGNAYSRRVNAVSDDNSPNNRIKMSNNSISSTRRCDNNEDLRRKTAVTDNHISEKAATKDCSSLDNTPAIADEGRARKQQGVSKIGRVDRVSLSVTSGCSYGKAESETGLTEDQVKMEGRSFYEHGHASGLRKPLVSALPVHVGESSKSPESGFSARACKLNPERILSNPSAVDRGDQQEMQNPIGKSTEANRVNIATKKPLQSKIPGKASASVRSLVNSNETTANVTHLKKPMQSSGSKSIVRGKSISSNSDCVDLRMGNKASVKPTGVLKGKSNILRPTEVSVGAKSSTQDNLKLSNAVNVEENTIPVLRSKSATTSAVTSGSAATKKAEYLRYSERDEIKPRALADSNKGQVAKATSQKSRPKVIKEGVVAKRTGPGSKQVDCNLQKKQYRESTSRRGIQEVKQGAPENIPSIVSVAKATAGKAVQGEIEANCRESYGSLEAVSGSHQRVEEKDMSLDGAVLRKDVKKVTFDEKTTIKKVVNLGDMNYGRKNAEEIKEVIERKEKNRREFSRMAGSGKQDDNEAGNSQNEIVVRAEGDSRNLPSLMENRKRKPGMSTFTDIGKPETKADLVEDYDNRKKRVEESGAWQHKHGIKFVECDKSKNVLYDEDHNNARPLRSVHVLVDEIVYKSDNSRCPTEGVLQTFSDLDFPASVKKNRASDAGSDRHLMSGSLDRIELKSKGKMKTRQSEHGDTLNVKSFSDPKLANESLGQGSGSLSKENTAQEKEGILRANSIQSIPIIEPVIRERVKGNQMLDFSGNGIPACKSYAFKMESALPNHPNSKSKSISFTNTPCYNTDSSPMASAEKLVESISQDDSKVTALKVQAVRNTVRQKAAKAGGIEGKPTVGPEDHRNVEQTTHRIIENEDRHNGAVTRKDTSAFLEHKDSRSYHALYESNGVVFTKPLEATSGEKSKQSISGAAVPPPPPKRTVTRYQGNQIKQRKDFEPHVNHDDSGGQYSGFFNALANTIPGERSSEPAMNWPLAANNNLSPNSLLSTSEQRGQLAVPQSCLKTNKPDFTIEENIENSNPGFCSGELPVEGGMGQNNVVHARPKMPPRESKANVCGVPNERKMSPILEDTGAEKGERSPLPNPGVNAVMLNYGCGMEELKKKMHVSQNARNISQAQVGGILSTPTSSLQPSVSSPSNAGDNGMGGSRCKKARSCKGSAEKPKQNSFIASLVRMLQEGRDESKTTSTDAINNYDKTVLVDMQVNHNYDPVGLTDDSYLIDEEDPFYQFSLKQGLQDKRAMSFDQCKGRQTIATSQEVMQSKDHQSLSRDSLRTNDIHDGHVIQVHNAYRSTGDSPGNISDPGSLKPALNYLESESPDKVMAAKDVKFSEKPVSSYAVKSTVNDGIVAREDRCGSDEVCLRPKKLPSDLSQDFITISGHKERCEISPREQQQLPKLSSFSSSVNSSKVKVMGNANNPDMSNDVIGLSNYLETDRGKENATLSLHEDRAAEVRENVRKLTELNLLKNSLKVAQSSAKSGKKKSSSKRKTKKATDYWWESGQRAVFYSDTEDLRVNTDLGLNTCSKRTKYDGAKEHKHKYDCFGIPEVGHTLVNHLNIDSKRSAMDVEGEVVLASPASDYYKSVVKNARNEIIGDQARKADLNEPKSTVEGFHFTRVEMTASTSTTNSPKSKPSAKVKPYTVVDLSTMSALSPEEVDTCLKEVSEAENRSWEKADSDCIDRGEAPDTLVLPPKGSRIRSNTTAGGTLGEEKITKLSKNSDMHEFAALKIVSSDNYSQPGSATNVELSSFRTRSKTAPSINDQLKNASKDHKPTSYNRQQSFDGDQSNIICISPTRRKGDGSHSCGKLLEVGSTSSQSMQNISQEFPPPPSEEELGEKMIERVQTPDWPPIPDSIDSIGNQCLKNVFLGHENTPKTIDSGLVPPASKEIDSNKQMKTGDPHRSLPPIPGVGGQGPAIADVPLAWVSKAMPHGTGPFIPFCQSTEDMDDLVKSHFYDDIDQIRKVAQERAMMIKRLEEEEEARVHCKENATGKVEGRNSLGYMPDLIPSSDEFKTAEGGRSEAVGHFAGLNLEDVRLNTDLKGEHQCHETASNLKSTESQSVTSIGKKNKSKFTKLFRKFYGQKSVDFIESKATPESHRTEILMSKREADRTEIFATPATNRRLFSLSKSRPQRHRTVSETGNMRAPHDIRTADDSKRSKNRTVSIGFGRRKMRKDVKLLYMDDESLRSLEALKINSDVSSDSGSSTRLSPVASPVLLDKDTSVKKYRAPEPPLSQQMAKDDGTSLQSELSSEHISGNDNWSRDMQPDMRNLMREKGLTREGRMCERSANERSTKDYMAKTSETKNQRDKFADRIPSQRTMADAMSIGARNDEVFHEGTYYNYPPSKTNSNRPAKPPRSESEDKEVSLPSGKTPPPEKPLRGSREMGLPIKPEPYSSQRSFRRVADQHDEIGTKLSPSSTSEDESNSVREYQVPFDRIDPERNQGYRIENGDWESNMVKSSASDFCLSSHFRRGNMLYQSDRTMERPSQFRRRGSFSSEIIGDSYYENLRVVSDRREDILDSYDKLLEIHQDTVKQIAEATVFKCGCKELHGTDWNDFEICGKMLNYGISSYVTVPVAVKRSGKRMEDKYTAWLRQSFGFLQSCGDGNLDYSVRDVTMHENLLHICQDIHHSGNTDDESSGEVPHDIHVKRMLVSKVTPKMSLNKYLALTMDRHATDPESYEKEACLIILQILKGLEHLGKHDLVVDSIDSESVLLSDIHRGVLSPHFNNNNNDSNSEVLGCPIAMFLALPGLLVSSLEVRGQPSNETLSTGQKGESGDGRVLESGKGVQDAEKEVVDKTTDNGKASSDQSTGNKEKMNSMLDRDHSRQLVSLIFDVFHASHLLGDELVEDSKSTDEVPILPVKSIYSGRLQGVIDKLFRNESNGIADLIREFQVVSFCPLFMENFALEELFVMLNKWRNRRCVDMVTDILKKYSLISLASGLASGGTNSMGLARNCVLECQFLSSVTAQEIAIFIHGENNKSCTR